MSVEVKSLWKYPVTGGPGISLESAEVYPGGFLGDRAFIVAEQKDAGFRRLGSKQAPELLGIAYDANGEVAYLDGSPLYLPSLKLDINKQADATCDEFGDPTPVWFTTPDYDAGFSDYLRRPVRFLQKTARWLLGDYIPAYQRANAALHIISDETVKRIAAESGSSTADERRFKPNIVLIGLEADEELSWVGRAFKLGGLASSTYLQIDRATPRCVVPSLDPKSGAKLGDISLRVMSKAPSGNGKTAFAAGVYAHLVDAHGQLSVGDKLQ